MLFVFQLPRTKKKNRYRASRVGSKTALRCCESDNLELKNDGSLKSLKDYFKVLLKRAIMYILYAERTEFIPSVVQVKVMLSKSQNSAFWRCFCGLLSCSGCVLLSLR